MKFCGLDRDERTAAGDVNSSKYCSISFFGHKDMEEAEIVQAGSAVFNEYRRTMKRPGRRLRQWALSR